jgi:tRNA dimethylallyltransferase
MNPVSTAPAIFIVGATASGKTAAALELARAFPVEVVNADSRQVYRGMDIGTAKPTRAEQALVPHHLIDAVNPDESYNLALFLRHARETITDIQARGCLPLVVGGTGQYIWGLAEGWQVPEVAAQPIIRTRLERMAQEDGPAALFAYLNRVDPEAAKTIDPQNLRRVVRALEVWEFSGVRFSAQRRRSAPGFRPHLFGLWVPRTELDTRFDARVEAMLEAGWEAEVRRLLRSGYTPELSAFQSTGYRELGAMAKGTIDLEEAVRLTKISTHRLARRQMNWFRHSDSRIHWTAGMAQLIEAVRRVIPTSLG